VFVSTFTPRRAAPWWGLLPGATKVVAARPSASPVPTNREAAGAMGEKVRATIV